MTTQKPIAYLAGPLGFSEAGRRFHNTVLIPLVEELGFEIRDPWTLTSQEIINSAQHLPYGEERRERLREVNRIIGRNNADAIEESHIIVAVLDGVDVDSGTAAEIAHASTIGKFVIGYRGDFRVCAKNEGSIVNPQVEHYIFESDGEIVTDLNSLREALLRFRIQFES